MDRRTFLSTGGAAVLGLALLRLPGGARVAPGSAHAKTIRMWSDPIGAAVGFDPVGLAVEPGTVVRWILETGVHSTTAYHARLHGNPTRIPAAARPWDSGILTRPGDLFEATLEVPGVYDYYCIPHEAAGMAGRIVVGTPGEEFEVPTYARVGSRPEGAHPSSAALDTFPTVERIGREGVVPLPGGTSSSNEGPR